jgi:hypothetical protein
MIELGKKNECFGVDDPGLFQPLTTGERLRMGVSRPVALPNLPEGWDLICGYDQGLGERLLVCESLEDAQRLYDAYARGGALGLTWYKGLDAGFVTVAGG